MNNKFLIGIIAAIIVLLIVGEILAASEILFVSHFITWIPLAVWIFLVWRVWKKGTSLFHDQMEPEIAKRRLKWLKIFMLLGGISYALLGICIFFWVGITGQPGMEDAVGLIPFPLGLLCAVGIIGSLVIFFKGRRKT